MCSLLEVLGGQNTGAAVMLSPLVQAVLQMGFQRSLVESLVQSRYLLTGSHYTSVSDLVTDVLQAEEEERHTGEPRPGVEGFDSKTHICTKPELSNKVQSVLSKKRHFSKDAMCEIKEDL